MLIRTVVAPLLGASCHLLVVDGRCVVVDPGGGVVPDVVALVEAEGWDVVALLATHGHVDHTWSAAELGAAFDVPLHIHASDAYRLRDPFGSLGPLGPSLEQLAVQAGWGSGPGTPDRVETFDTDDGGTLTLRLGEATGTPVVLTALHAPGHTEGSTVYLVDAPAPTALTGDVLFAGTIGRTDLPGGDGRLMTRTLRRLAALPPETAVLPGHGPSTTIEAELGVNPYLRAAR